MALCSVKKTNKLKNHKRKLLYYLYIYVYSLFSFNINTLVFLAALFLLGRFTETDRSNMTAEEDLAVTAGAERDDEGKLQVLKGT